MTFIKQRLMLSALLITIVTPTAWAASVTNLSDEPQKIYLSTFGYGNEMTIAEGETVRIPGKITVRHGESEIKVEGNEDFAIWNNDVFGPQKRGRTHSMAGF